MKSKILIAGGLILAALLVGGIFFTKDFLLPQAASSLSGPTEHLDVMFLRQIITADYVADGEGFAESCP